MDGVGVLALSTLLNPPSVGHGSAVDRVSSFTTTVLVLLAGALYVCWTAPGILIYDTAELSGAAFRLGVSHPPGQPTYSLIGKLCQLVPLGSIAFRTNLLSAICAAVSLWLVARLTRAFSRRLEASPLFSMAPPLVVLALGASGPFVNQATRTEVYSPALVLVLAALLGVCHAVRPIEERPRAIAHLAGAGLCAGLAATLHPAAGLGTGVAGLVAVILLRPDLLRSSRSWLYTIGGLVLGNAPQAFVVLRCRSGAEPCWEVPTDVGGFWRYVSGAAYRGNLQSGTAALRTMHAAVEFTVSATGYAVPILVGLTIAGGVLSGRSKRIRELAALFAAILTPFAFIVVAPFYPANPDAQGYLLPSLAVLFVAAPLCALSLAPRIGAPLAATLAAATAALAVANGAGWRFARAAYYLPADLAEQALSEPTPKALVVANSDHLFFGMQYGQLTEGARPDVGIMVEGSATRSHHWKEVARRRPEVDLRRARPKKYMELRGAFAYSALQMARGVLPRWVESPWVTDEHVCVTGALSRVGPCDGGGHAPFPVPIARELERRIAQYSDGTDRTIYLWRWYRAWARERDREIDAAVEEVRAALWEERAELDAALEGFSASAVVKPPILTPSTLPFWVGDKQLLRASLAQFLYRGGRTDLAVWALERDFRDGNPQAALVLGEIMFREGRLDEATRIYRAFARSYPEQAGYAYVGLALVRATRGDGPGAEALLDRAGRDADPLLVPYRDRMRDVVVPAILQSREPRGGMIRQ